MRIIGGNLKGRKLLSVKNIGTRPTSSRVRESIFNIISHKLENTRILDLFAGTGSLGIEALSRGAGSAVFVELEKKNVSSIASNLSKLSLITNVSVIRWNILKNLNCLMGGFNAGFEFVFIDPPYNCGMIGPTLENLLKVNVLKIKSCIVVEHSIKELIGTELPEGLCLLDQRNYGKTTVSFFTIKSALIY